MGGWAGLLRLACTALASLPLTLGARAQTVEEFYKGKQITLLTLRIFSGNGPYGTAVSHHMPKYIPGHPTIVLKELPAAAGLQILNTLYNVAPRDGLTLATLDRNVLMEPLMGNSNANYDASKFTGIASIGKLVVVCSVGAQSKIMSIQQAMKDETLVGALNPNDIFATYPLILNTVLHTKFKVIPGYDASQSIYLAIERSEVDGICGAWSTLKVDKPDWVTQKKIRPLLQVSFTGHPDVVDVPKLQDFVKNEEEREMLDFYASADVIGRPWLGPPGLPTDRTAALRAAFEATMKDPEFLAEAQKLNLEIAPSSGEEVEQRLKAIYATPKLILQRIIDTRRAAAEKK